MRKNLSKRRTEAMLRHGRALSMFKSAAAELEAVAEAHAQVADEALREEVVHAQIKVNAVNDAAAARNSAAQLRALVGEN